LIFNYYFKEETIRVLVITEGEKLMKRQKENVEKENSLQITYACCDKKVVRRDMAKEDFLPYCSPRKKPI
jgi:intracellular sulfur oxidation DsrE/DsrF family protein